MANVRSCENFKNSYTYHSYFVRSLTPLDLLFINLFSKTRNILKNAIFLHENTDESKIGLVNSWKLLKFSSSRQNLKSKSFVVQYDFPSCPIMKRVLRSSYRIRLSIAQFWQKQPYSSFFNLSGRTLALQKPNKTI